MSEEHLFHGANRDGKGVVRKFYMVKGKHVYGDGRKPSNHSATFDNKELALKCAQSWKLSMKADTVKVLECEADWAPFVPNSKADKELMEKIANG